MRLWKLVTVAGGLGLAGLLALRVGVAWQAKRAPAESAAAPVTVSVARATRHTVEERVVLTGVIRPRNEIDIFVKMPGRVERVLVDVGKRVKVGELLAAIEHREIEWQQPHCEPGELVRVVDPGRCEVKGDCIIANKLFGHRRGQGGEPIVLARLRRGESHALAVRHGGSTARPSYRILVDGLSIGLPSAQTPPAPC